MWGRTRTISSTLNRPVALHIGRSRTFVHIVIPIMSTFDALVKFKSKEDGGTYFAPVSASVDAELQVPMLDSIVLAYSSVDDLQRRFNGRERTIEKVWCSKYCIAVMA